MLIMKRTRVVFFSIELKEEQKTAQKQEEIEQLSGKLSSDFDEKRLMHSVLEADKDAIDDGKLIRDALNQGINSFTPDLFFESLMKNFSLAKNIFGESIIRNVTGYDAKYLERNIKIPEFRKELKKSIYENLENEKRKGILDENYSISKKGVELASLINYFEELDNLAPKAGFGERVHKKSCIYGDKGNVKNFSRERYKDIAIRSSMKKAIRRGHQNLEMDDLKAFERQSKGTAYIIYGLDASGSMRGQKIEMAKKAGIALAYKAMQEKDKVGLIVFGSEIKEFLEPTSDFSLLLKEITKARASKETNIALTIKKAVELFPNKDVTKHFILLTDAMPTSGENPEKETMDAVSEAANSNITISVVGIDLDREGKKLGQKITEIGKGRFYLAKDLKEIDKIMLQDYYEFS